ncbi:hypothetical protein [Bacillus gaemokensis]|uniref:Group-specific protein n=1 Tax=Bacillus gaemokensis TaxID=574375 RepID=A0A073KA98_9BACI|nr:hypothetical protein [Bacillus gaemokensis]KEK23465.1 hypothetical protein BAGA_08155 [Bacillus gaemokensis]KYG27167.1 hypothetical protein AZF08_15550 [Bacillus gaemokensis]
MIVRIIISSLVIATLFYVTIIFLPEFMNINEHVLKWSFVTVAGILFVVSKNKWWVNLVSMFVAIIIFGVIVILTVT